MKVDPKERLAFEREYREFDRTSMRFHVKVSNGEYVRRDLNFAYAIWQKLKAEQIALQTQEFRHITTAGKLPGVDGWTAALFLADDVPLNTPIYVRKRKG